METVDEAMADFRSTVLNGTTKMQGCLLRLRTSMNTEFREMEGVIAEMTESLRELNKARAENEQGSKPI